MSHPAAHPADPGPQGGPWAGRCCPVIAGPTAVGKTALVTSLAARHPIEVISLDSRQIYHGLRIGTAQPTAREIAVCPHHLIDFVSPAASYDAVRYREDFEKVYRDIVARGGAPLLVGGAGMYLTALREGFMHIPGSTPDRVAEERAALNPLSDGEIRELLKDADPASFARIHANDRYRSQRALEIFRISGKSMSSLQATQRPDPALGLAFPTFVLERPVAELDRRIALRTRVMLEAGWLEETEAALAKYPPDCPGLRSIGYREIVQVLRGERERDQLAEAVILATRQYAKRQRTWFRNTPHTMAGSPDDSALAAAILPLLSLGKGAPESA